MYHPQLDVFITVADCGSFTKAAERLYISPTAVMKRMNVLEERLRLTLLYRTPQGVALTEEGNAIYKDAKQMIAFSAESVRNARQLAQNRQYTLRVGTSLMNPCKPLMDIWKDLNGNHPNFHLKVVPYIDDSQGILHILDTLGTSFDLIVAACNSAEWFKRCGFYPLGAYRVCCALPQRHPLSGRKLLAVEELHGQRLMVVPHGDSLILDELRDWLGAEHPEIEIVDTSAFYDAEVLNRCEQEGNILLTLDGWKEVHPLLETIPVDWSYTMPYGLVYPLNPPENVARFLGALQGVQDKGHVLG